MLTAAEAQKKREAYEEYIFKLYLDGRITEEEMLEMLDK